MHNESQKLLGNFQLFASNNKGNTSGENLEIAGLQNENEPIYPL